MELREQLELAALAAGMRIDKSPTGGGGGSNTGFDSDGYAVLDWHNGSRWGPHLDDGDSRRLQVALFIQLRLVRDGYPGFANALGVDLNGKPIDVYEDLGDDPAAAARVAVLNVAAQMGRAMKETDK